MCVCVCVCVCVHTCSLVAVWTGKSGADDSFERQGGVLRGKSTGLGVRNSETLSWMTLRELLSLSDVLSLSGEQRRDLSKLNL